MRRGYAARLRTRLRATLVNGRVMLLRKLWKMEIGQDTRISLKANLDRTNPQGLHIGHRTGVAAGSNILTHDFIGNRHTHTRIGDDCHIGTNAVILPGVTIGDQCIVAPGAVVMRDVPAHSLVAGNPARVMESGLRLGPWGQRLSAPSPLNSQSTQSQKETCHVAA